jgi:hypothetical protein
VVVAIIAAMVAVARTLAADQDPGDRPVTGQPPARLRIQRGRPADLATQPTRAEEAVQRHRHQQLGPHPTGLGQLAGFQAAAGQLARASARR